MGRGARALDNLRTATGEPSLEKHNTLLSDLQSGGVNSNISRKKRITRRTLCRIAGWIARTTTMEIVYNNLKRTLFMLLVKAYLHP